MEHELTLIGKLGYEPYFLTVHDVVQFARSRGILCQGRGSAANSVVCYCLGVTSVSPEIGTMVFERFVSEARNEPPDIDVDFEHERREEVIQHIYERYGRHRAGLCATVIHYRGKRAIREVGRAMGLTDDTISAISSQLWGFFSTEGLEHQRLREIGLDPTDRRLAQTLELIHEIQGFPRHLSQHVGGFVMTEGRLDELVPIENATMEERTVICWDKDDIDALGILKVDVLALGMLSCIRKAFDLIRRHHRHRLRRWPRSRPRTPPSTTCSARPTRSASSRSRSRAQMNFLPRMRPRTLLRPRDPGRDHPPRPDPGRHGPPLPPPPQRARRRSTSPPTHSARCWARPSACRSSRSRRCRSPSSAPASRPRRPTASAARSPPSRSTATSAIPRPVPVGHEAQNGYDADFAQRCFSQIEGFGSYGFPESHAASFALLVYASAWLKRHHPGIFACALLNAQPMGFYAPAQIVRDAREHGVDGAAGLHQRELLGQRDGAPARRGALALRLGFRQIKAMREEEANWIAAARGNGYHAVEDVWRRAGTRPALLRALAEADAFATLGLSRRDALWAARALADETPLPLFAGDMDGEGIVEDARAPPRHDAEGEEVVEDYVAMRLTLRKHPMAFLRHLLTPGTPPLDAAGAVAGPDGPVTPPHGWTPPAHEVRGPGTLMAPIARHPRDVDPFRGAQPPARSFDDVTGITRSEWWGPDETGKLACATRRD